MPEIPSMPHTWIELIAFAVFMAFQAFTAWQNYQLKLQGDVQLKKQDVAIVKADAGLHNQVELAKQLNGATEIKLVAATEAGKNVGRIEGAATEQARVATQVALATKEAIRLSSDDTPAYKGPVK